MGKEYLLTKDGIGARDLRKSRLSRRKQRRTASQKWEELKNSSQSHLPKPEVSYGYHVKNVHLLAKYSFEKYENLRMVCPIFQWDND